MARYVFYGRTSSDNQRKDETIETQIEAARSWSERTGLRLTRHYLDDGISSSTPFAERDEGRRLLEDARSQRFTHALVYNFRRLGRDQLDTLQTIKALSEIGVRIQSICEPVPDGSEDDLGLLMIGVLTSFGQYDWIQLRRLLSAGKEKWAGEGYWPGGPTPFGYRLNVERRKRLVRDERELAVARRIVDMMLAGDRSTHAISALLNADGTPTPKAMRDGNISYRWTPGLISKMLSNPLYAGRIVWRGRMVAEAPELAIITEAEAARLREIIESNKAKSPRNSKREYWLRGMVECGVCGKAMCGWTGGTWFGKGQERGISRSVGTVYYRCCSRYSKAGRCAGIEVNGEKLEAAVWHWCVEAVAKPEEYLDELREYLRLESTGDDSTKRLEQLREAQDNVKASRARALNMLVRGMMTETDAVPMLETLETEAETVDAEIARLESAARRAASVETLVSERRKLIAQLRRTTKTEDLHRRRFILEQLARRVKVTHTTRGAVPDVLISPKE
jgi:site-specific DNA recombinase